MKSIQKSPEDTTAPARVPLDEFAPDIFAVAQQSNDDVDRLRTILEAIALIGKDPGGAGRLHRASVMHDLAQIGKDLADDLHNVRDCQIAEAMLASEDPEIRKAARP